MRIATFLLTSLLFAGVAQAQTSISPLTGSNGTPNGPATQTSPSASTGAPGARAGRSAPAHRRRTMAERFSAANTTNDGHLTLDQAKAGHMNAIARDFDKIDKDHHGYVTVDDIRDYNHARREAHRAARTVR